MLNLLVGLQRINNDLCPECVEAFDKMVNDFMDCKEE